MFETTNTATAINPLAVLKPAKPPRLYTLEEYLRFEARSQDKHEYYNGKIIKMAYARGPVNRDASQSIQQDGQVVRFGKPPCRLFGKRKYFSFSYSGDYQIVIA